MAESESHLNLHDRERILADQLRTSCTPGEIARGYLGIPQDVQGLTIVDLAAGASSLVADLLQDGADAYAIDPVYRRGQAAIQAAIAESMGIVLDGLPEPYASFMMQQAQRAMDAFNKSMGAHPDRYQPGYFTRLPFPDEFSDMTISMNGLSSVFEQPDIANAAIDEAIRITKVGGRVVICPLLLDPMAYRDEIVEAHEQVVDTLRERGLAVAVEHGIHVPSDIPLDEYSRLTIVRL